MNNGTHEGDVAEIEFVKKVNANKSDYPEYFSSFGKTDNLFVVRVSTKQHSELSGKTVFTRSDCYLIRTKNDISKILKMNDYYLDEGIIKSNRIAHDIVCYSGISIKLTQSKNYQLLKMTPNSFCNMFESYELGAGAALYCSKDYKLSKNKQLISGWNSSISKMTEYFEEITEGDANFHLNKDKCKKIKTASVRTITSIIDSSTELQQKIFNGIGLYEEPYTAWYFYHGECIVELKKIPYYITTGSGRSRGEYTLVLKPKN